MLLFKYCSSINLTFYAAARELAPSAGFLCFVVVVIVVFRFGCVMICIWMYINKHKKYDYYLVLRVYRMVVTLQLRKIVDIIDV